MFYTFPYINMELVFWDRFKYKPIKSIVHRKCFIILESLVSCDFYTIAHVNTQNARKQCVKACYYYLANFGFVSNIVFYEAM